jgi:hypothetical protein
MAQRDDIYIFESPNMIICKFPFRNSEKEILVRRVRKNIYDYLAIFLLVGQIREARARKVWGVG